MKIRAYQHDDLTNIVSLFYDAVHSIPSSDYSADQLEAWAPESERNAVTERLRKAFSANIVRVAEGRDGIMGFCDMTSQGYLDHMYVGSSFQRKGTAGALLRELEKSAEELGVSRITTDASITARPFFEKSGFHVLQPRIAERQGVQLKNFRMHKILV
ncbi:GNAT family N-acetyltransferase [Metabacillus sp. 84]|uniref:GNAT family N-acetyltransferase n=1 Tax=unclassified Metabacillus TaxID=2675274 RepID=UPI003CF55058